MAAASHKFLASEEHSLGLGSTWTLIRSFASLVHSVIEVEQRVSEKKSAMSNLAIEISADKERAEQLKVNSDNLFVIQSIYLKALTQNDAEMGRLCALTNSSLAEVEKLLQNNKRRELLGRYVKADAMFAFINDSLNKIHPSARKILQDCLEYILVFAEMGFSSISQIKARKEIELTNIITSNVPPFIKKLEALQAHYSHNEKIKSFVSAIDTVVNQLKRNIESNKVKADVLEAKAKEAKLLADLEKLQEKLLASKHEAEVQQGELQRALELKEAATLNIQRLLNEELRSRSEEIKSLRSQVEDNLIVVDFPAEVKAKREQLEAAQLEKKSLEAELQMLQSEKETFKLKILETEFVHIVDDQPAFEKAQAEVKQLTLRVQELEALLHAERRSALAKLEEYKRSQNTLKDNYAKALNDLSQAQEENKKDELLHAQITQHLLTQQQEVIGAVFQAKKVVSDSKFTVADCQPERPSLTACLIDMIVPTIALTVGSLACAGKMTLAITIGGLALADPVIAVTLLGAGALGLIYYGLKAAYNYYQFFHRKIQLQNAQNDLVQAHKELKYAKSPNSFSLFHPNNAERDVQGNPSPSLTVNAI